MSKIFYKPIDGRGRITLPPECRASLELNGGDIIRIETDDEFSVLYISKLDVLDMQAEAPEFVAECLAATVKCLNNEQKVSLAAYLLSKASDIDVFEGEGADTEKSVTADKEELLKSGKKTGKKSGGKAGDRK